MKQKIISEPATREDLGKTEKTLRQEMQETEKRLRQEMQEIRKELRKDIEVSAEMVKFDTRRVIDDSKIELEAKMTQFKDVILTAIDPLLRELEERRQEREIGADQYYKVRQQLENHDPRLTKLEHA